jgi:Phospholipase_D-nuclease N-terminal
MLAADYPFLNLFWTMMVFFGWIIWLVVLFMVLADNFRRSDHSGWAKAGWTVFVIFVPVIGVLFYVVTRPHIARQGSRIGVGPQELGRDRP